MIQIKTPIEHFQVQFTAPSSHSFLPPTIPSVIAASPASDTVITAACFSCASPVLSLCVDDDLVNLAMKMTADYMRYIGKLCFASHFGQE